MTDAGPVVATTAGTFRSRLTRSLRSVVCILGLLAGVPSASAQFIQDAVPGGLIEIPLAPLELSRPEAYFGQKQLLVMPFGRRWSGLAGLPLGMVPGTYVIQVRFTDSDKLEDRAFTVYPGRGGGRTRVALPGPPPEALETEFAWREPLEAELPLIAPVAATARPLFGRYREESTAGGPYADFVAFRIPGTLLVRAPGVGRVTATIQEEAGTWVWIDHGMGLYTRLGPITETNLNPSNTVAAGQAIGRFRLDEEDTPGIFYLSVFLNGAAIDPFLIFDMDSTTGGNADSGRSRPGRAR